MQVCNTTIDQLLRQHAVLNPNDLAIKYFPLNKECKRISYGKLNKITDNLAKFINDLNNKKNKKIVIFGDRSPFIVYAIMGIFKSCSTYSIIDTCHPVERIKIYLDILEPDMCITYSYICPDALKSYFTNILEKETLDKIFETQITQHISHDLQIKNCPNDTAVCTFTSGSTGMPKCVMGRHSSLTVFYEHVKHKFDIKKESRYGMLSGISHDPLQRDIFTPIYFGSCIYIPDQCILLDANKISIWLIENEINIICVTPSMLQILISANKNIPSLTHIFSVGEKLYKKDASKILTLASNAQIINMYGSTETQRAVSMYQVTLDLLENNEILKNLDVIPSGKCIGPAELLILDKDNKIVNTDEIGEIYVRSQFISKGYYNSDNETKEKFIKNPITNDETDIIYKTGDLGKFLPDGNVLCLGRIDNQVKIRGYRVELNEIDICLSKNTNIFNSITLIDKYNDNEMLLTWVKSTLNKDEILEYLKSNLPHYMIPDDIIHVKEFEINHNCKIDTTKLPKYKCQSKEINKNEICHYISYLLNTEVNENTNLFDYGLNSIIATQIISYINRSYNKSLKITDIYKNQTINSILNNDDNKVNLISKIEEYYKQINTKNVNKNKVFLTGCTGFLGIHILSNYLINAKNTCDTIYVLVRAKTKIEAMEKINNSLEKYCGIKLNNILNLNNKLQILLGDLNENNLGLNVVDYLLLTNTINLIIHNGAEVDWIKSFDQLANVNVRSTVDIIKLAKRCRNNVKINFISSTAIYDNNYHKNLMIIPENTKLSDDVIQNISTGYAETKYVSERLIQKSKTDGISYNIFRTGYLICNDQTFKWLDRDFLVKLLKHCIKYRIVPILHNQYMYIKLLPVNYAAECIIKCSHNEVNKTINLVGKQIDFCQYLSIIKDIMPVTEIEYKLWKESIKDNDELFILKDFIPDLDNYLNKTYNTQIISKYLNIDSLQLQYIIKIYIQQNLIH